MRNKRFRDVKQLAQDHTANKWRCKDLNLDNEGLVHTVITTLKHREFQVINGARTQTV